MSFPSVFFIDTTCFDECLLFYVKMKTVFFTQIYCTQEARCNRHIDPFFETSNLKEVRILCSLSPQ